MQLNKSKRDNIIRRRAIVSKMRLRGMTMDAIAHALMDAGIVNPDTGDAYSKVTIKNDLDALKDEWRTEAAETIDKHQARQLGEIAEVKKMAWSDRDGSLALRAIDLEMKLLGTRAPEKIDMNVSVHYTLFVEVVQGIEAAGDDAQVVFNRLLEVARMRADERS